MKTSNNLLRLISKIILMLILCQTKLTAQHNETLRSDRPGQANSPYAVGKNSFQIQTGIDFGGIRINQTKYSDFYTSSSVFRFGVLEKFELNLGIDFRKDQITNTNFSGRGLSSFVVGSRINLIEESDKAPAIGFQVGVNLPILTADYAIDKAAPRFAMILSKNLSENFGVNFNVGVLNSGISSQPIGTYVANFNYAINDKLGVFIEAYGFYTRQVIQNYFDFGLSYLSTNNLQLDLYAGVASISGQVNYFASFGVSLRLPGAND